MMKAAGVIIALYGWLMSVTGFNVQVFATIILGAALALWGYYIERR